MSSSDKNRQLVRIVTDFNRFPPQWQALCGAAGTATEVRALAELKQGLSSADIVVINGDIGLLMRLVLWFWLGLAPRRPIVAVDIVLRVPRPGWRGWLALKFKRWVLSHVDLFIHYFRDTREYERIYGISDAKSCYVPFKANGGVSYKCDVTSAASLSLGEHVLCAGRSLRDYDTFFEAMEGTEIPAAVPEPDFTGLREHGSRWSRKREQLPKNLRLLPDRGGPNAWRSHLEAARLVVIPVLKQSICASGIGTYLDAMALGKCVIVSRGPGVSDVLTNQVLMVDPEDPQALRAAIVRAWNDQPLREQVAIAGFRYAQECGEEADLYQRIIDQVASRFVPVNSWERAGDVCSATN
jgi:glycosyltransferase involved in cell wall biosynthesis